MPYAVFLKDKDNEIGSLVSIAENDFDLNSLTLILSDYKVISMSQSDFENVALDYKNIAKYQNNNIIFENTTYQPTSDKVIIKLTIENLKKYIKFFLDNNSNHSKYTVWKNYYDQLDSFNVNTMDLPLNHSIYNYFKSKNLISLNPLQLP
jgi:hypothetical protein